MKTSNPTHEESRPEAPGRLQILTQPAREGSSMTMLLQDTETSLGAFPVTSNDLTVGRGDSIEVYVVEGAEDEPTPYAAVRVPGWCEAATLDLNGARAARDAFAAAVRVLEGEVA